MLNTVLNLSTIYKSTKVLWNILNIKVKNARNKKKGHRHKENWMRYFNKLVSKWKSKIIMWTIVN